MNCPRCGGRVLPQHRFCGSCGAEQPTPPRSCHACGTPASAGDRFCHECGASLAPAGPTPPEVATADEPETAAEAPVARPTATATPSVSPYAPATSPKTAAPNRSSRRYAWLLLLIIPLVLICAVVVALPLARSAWDRLPVTPGTLAGGASDRPALPRPAAAVGAVALSDEQQRLADRYGPPDSFTLLFGIGADEPARLELWNYGALGTSFAFADGAFRGVDEIGWGDSVGEPQLRPDLFDRGMSLDDVNAVVGDIPRGGGEVVPEIAAGMSIYAYDQGLVVGFMFGELVLVSTEVDAASP